MYMALNCLNIYKKAAKIKHKKKPTINGRLKQVLRYEKTVYYQYK